MFDIQLFGNNDTIKSSADLKVNMGFVDGDTRLVTLSNPKPAITAESISSAFALINPSDTDTSLLVGDKNGTDFAGLIEAYKLDVTDRILDLT